MTTLPTASTFQQEPMDAQTLSDALVQLRDFIAEAMGTAPDAAAVLGVLGALVSGHAAASSARSIAATDRGRVIACTGSWALTLGDAATLGAGFAFVAANRGTGTITLTPSGGDQIDDAATAALGPGRAALVVSTGTGWITLALPGTAAGALRLTDGTVAEPGLAFAADPDTGLRRAGPDQIGFVAGGTQRAVLSDTALQVDVPVTGTAVQAGGSDSTVGRLVRLSSGTGVFGLGLNDANLNTATSDDLNALRRSGFWRYQSATVGRPAGTAGVMLHLSRLAGQGIGFHVQIAFPHIANERIGRRVMADGTGAWEAWDYLFSQRTAIGAVSQSGGVPTGALIERGSNANGEFARWADGTQMCWRAVTANLAIDTGFMGGFRSGGQNSTYPASFVAPPVTSVFPLNATAFGACAQGAPSTASWSWAVTAVTSQSAADRTVQLMAVGRWF